MDELLTDFIAETRETLAPLGGEIVAWEADPTDRARLDAIFRFVHTVKGSCGFLDLPRLERLSHAAESALAAVRDGTREPDRALVNAVLAIIDRIGEVTEAIAAGTATPDSDDELLILAVEARAVPAAPAPAAASLAVEADEAPAPAPVAEAGTAAPAAGRSPARSIRLPVDLLDRMMAGVSDMVLARNELSRRLRDRGGDAGVDAAFERLSTCVAEMREAITRTRMQRIDGLFSALPRMVRDLSAELGKQVRLVVDGGDVELDREMIEMIRDPLTHIVRNSVDHGIEDPAERALALKPAAGLLSVTARQAGNQILIEIADDGRGIDDERLVAKAIANGIVTAEQGAAMPRRDRLDLIFAPGLSTASAVTAVSGRGVGMDVVRSNVERIGGSVEVESQLGRGFRLTLRVPMTLTIIPALTFSVGTELFAIPRGAIDEIARVAGGSVQVESVGGMPIARIRGERLPVVELAPLLGLDAHVALAQAILVVVRASSGERYALAVDSVQDHEELVVKPAAPAIMATGVYGGTTLPDNGRPMLVINPAGIAQVAGVRAAEDVLARRATETVATVETVPTLLFQALDGATRAIRLGLVERIEDAPAHAVARAGGRLGLVHGGHVLPLFGCDSAPQGDSLRFLLLGDGEAEIGYAITEVIDIHELPPGCTPAAEPGPIEGVVLVDGRQVELIDAFWLFANAGATARAAQVMDRPLCLLDDSDPWMRDVLRPIVEQAGYRTAFLGQTPETPIVTILSSHTPPVRRGEAALIRLRSSADPAAVEGDSIYRYDRAGLMRALVQAGGR